MLHSSRRPPHLPAVLLARVLRATTDGGGLLLVPAVAELKATSEPTTKWGRGWWPASWSHPLAGMAQHTFISQQQWRGRRSAWWPPMMESHGLSRSCGESGTWRWPTRTADTNGKKLNKPPLVSWHGTEQPFNCSYVVCFPLLPT